MSNSGHKNELLFKFRQTDTVRGITRQTTQLVAKALGLTEAQTIHLAMARLASEVLPAYEGDDGPLSREEMDAIDALTTTNHSFRPTKSLF